MPTESDSFMLLKQALSLGVSNCKLYILNMHFPFFIVKDDNGLSDNATLQATVQA